MKVANFPTHAITEFTQADLRERWNKNYMPGISLRTTIRHIYNFGLMPHRRAGLQPFYLLADVVAMEKRRADKFLARFDDRDDGAAIITVAKAKKLASNGGRRK